ncbi:MAG: DNA methylase [Catonella sp.]|jgi:DNA polymerase V|nr:DNA methylase [Catonella sp.]MDY6357193.1 DNA methylase [Catonella sp.]
MSEERIYACIDLKSFYASVECAERGLDPLTTRLVVADESRTDKTICLAVSPALKAFGIPGRARLFEVRQKLNRIEAETGKKVDFIIAKPRMKYYMEYSAKIYQTYLKYISSSDMVSYSIDEVFFDLTDYVKYYKKTARELVMTMIKDVLNTTGITATAGIGTNLYLAKIAMDIEAKHIDADENGVRIAELDEMAYKVKLWGHEPITDFWRVGRGTANKLAEYGMFTMGDIAAMSLKDEEKLYTVFGIDAELLIDHAWGLESCTMEDIKAYEPDSNSISTGQVLSRPYSFDEGLIIVKEMAEELALSLVEKKKMTDLVSLFIGYDRISVDNGKYSGKTTRDRYGRKVPPEAHGSHRFENYTSGSEKIIKAFTEIYNEKVNPDLMIRRITVDASDIIDENKVNYQFSIFDDVKKDEQERKMQEALLSIRKKYGKNSVLRGMDMLDAATRKERNGQIGGHKA